MTLRRCPARLALVLLVSSAAIGAVVAAETETSVRLLLGHDTNPNRVSFDGEPGGMFSDQRADVGFRFRPKQRTRGFFDLAARQRIHESSLSDADTLTAAISAGLSFRPVRSRERSLLIRIGARGRYHDATFVDPETGRVFDYERLAPGGGIASTPVPDRFDYMSAGTFFDLRWKVNRRVRLSIDTAFDRRDYTEDYVAAGLDSLDYRALRVEPGIRARLGRVVTIDATMPMTKREYDDRAALDAAGNAVNGALREYEYRGVRLAVILQPRRSLKLRVDARRTDRTDRHAGYYDSTADTVYLWLEKKFGERAGLELYASRTQYEYDNATVPDDPTNLLRGGDYLTVLGRFERSLGRMLRLYAETGSETADNHDPSLAHDRRWAMAGIRIGN